jgi:GT2 family glycosyltransferase
MPETTLKNHASIIIPVFNQLKFTRQCIESLLRDKDRGPYEIIVVDNASSDGTRYYLEATANELARTTDRLFPIFNDTNRGVAPAWNQGLKQATGSMIGILNNDIVLSRGWFRSLLWAIEHHRLALVSPFAEGGELNYEFDARAKAFTHKNLSKLWKGYDFSAVVLPRQTFEKIGYFDEGYLIGGYEDTDYCYRLDAQKLRYGISGAAFIHHFGSQTLGEFKVRGDKHAAHNRDYFISKWKKDPSEGVNSVGAKLKRSWKRLKLRWDVM